MDKRKKIIELLLYALLVAAGIFLLIKGYGRPENVLPPIQITQENAK